MAKAIQFPEANTVFTAPNCYDLHSWDAPTEGEQSKHYPLKISCWQLTEEELRKPQKNGGKLWLFQYSVNQPPTNLQVDSPFEPTEDGD